MKFDRQMFIQQNRQEYADVCNAMNWISSDAAEAAHQYRLQLLEIIGNNSERRFSDTKLFTHGISPGCELCGEGAWSCLFINGICNARCFYCPSMQNEKGIPSTNSLRFENPVDYGDYLKCFGVKGVSFSGGEPLLTFEKTLQFLKQVRRQKERAFYTWMYTNGILATPEKLAALAGAGLDEIRFDISADRYRLDHAAAAIGVIGRVTVEIPAIPEDLKRLKRLVRDLDEMGIDFVNLHQLRCTPYNCTNLMQRNYTFLHGPRVTVLESELAALEVIRYAIEEKITLPVHYCSYTYKHQFQGAGARRRSAILSRAPYEDVTKNGYIRRMTLSGSPGDIRSIHTRLVEAGCDPGSWALQGNGDRLFFNASVWPCIDFSGSRLSLQYYNTALRPTVSYSQPFREIQVNRYKKVIIEKKNEIRDVVFQGDAIHEFAARYIATPPRMMLPDDRFSDIDGYENFLPGLMPYF